ncbi:MAG: terminase large subunit domain-containing protein [Gimesia chilikensis]
MGTVYLPRPLNHQREILLDDSRFKLLTCGRRWGKTTTGLLAILRGHGRFPGQYKGALDGGRVWWIAPTYPQIVSSKIWVDLKRATKDAWSDKSEQNRQILLPNGGEISVRSADNPDSLLGGGLDGVVIDEAARVPEHVWRETIRPALADKQGWAIFATTPNGKNWYHREHVEAATRPGWRAWQLPSSDNPLITPEEMEDVRREIGPRAFAQEHEAQFMEIAGALWPSDYFAESIWCRDWPDRFEASAIAIDPSMGKSEQSDPSAIVFVGLHNGRLYVDGTIERRTPGKIVDDAITLFGRYNPGAIGCESNGFQAVLQNEFDRRCRERNQPLLPLMLVHNSEAKQIRIQRLDPYLDRGLLRFRDCEHMRTLVDQLIMFPTKGSHDDGPDALEMGIRLLRREALSQDHE